MVCRAVALSGQHQVETLTSAQEALRRAQAGERWNLVLCDLAMPELTGPQLVEALLQQAPALADRVVYMTGGAAGEKGGGGRLCLRKPLVIDELRRVVAERRWHAAAPFALAGVTTPVGSPSVRRSSPSPRPRAGTCR